MTENPDLTKHPTPVERLAAHVEDTRVAIADDVEITRAELASILEADRKRHNLRMEQRLKERAKQTNQRFMGVFLAFILITVLLAYRTEINSDELRDQQGAIEQTAYLACLTRAERQVGANVGRETMVQLAVNGPNAPADEAGKTEMQQRLRDALLLPVEDCGTPP